MFLIDIDGVLKLGDKAIPRGVEALRKLQDKQIPYVLVSNGTGTEALKAASVSKVFGVEVKEHEMVLSTTALRDYLCAHPELRLLSIGCAAHHDAFYATISNEVTTPREVICRYPRIAPQLRYVGDCRHAITQIAQSKTFEEVDAIVFFSDSVDYYEDIYVAVDVYLNNGSLNPDVCAQRARPAILLANPDIVYADRTLQPKMTVGAELLCFRALVEHLSGAPLDNVIAFGKPHSTIFECARKLLQRCDKFDSAKTVYMVGDSLVSDIIGANYSGISSVLVLSGITKHADEWQEHSAAHKPKFVFADLLEAIHILCDI